MSDNVVHPIRLHNLDGTKAAKFKPEVGGSITLSEAESRLLSFRLTDTTRRTLHVDVSLLPLACCFPCTFKYFRIYNMTPEQKESFSVRDSKFVPDAFMHQLSLMLNYSSAINQDICTYSESKPIVDGDLVFLKSKSDLPEGKRIYGLIEGKVYGLRATTDNLPTFGLLIKHSQGRPTESCLKTFRLGFEKRELAPRTQTIQPLFPVALSALWTQISGEMVKIDYGKYHFLKDCIMMSIRDTNEPITFGDVLSGEDHSNWEGWLFEKGAGPYFFYYCLEILNVMLEGIEISRCLHLCEVVLLVSYAIYFGDYATLGSVVGDNSWSFENKVPRALHYKRPGNLTKFNRGNSVRYLSTGDVKDQINKNPMIALYRVAVKVPVAPSSSEVSAPVVRPPRAQSTDGRFVKDKKPQGKKFSNDQQPRGRQPGPVVDNNNAKPPQKRGGSRGNSKGKYKGKSPANAKPKQTINKSVPKSNNNNSKSNAKAKLNANWMNN